MTLVFIFVLVSSAVVGIIMLLFKAVLNFAGRELSAESKETVLMVLLSFQPISAAIMLVAESIPLQPYPTVGHEVLAFVTASAAEVSAETIKSGSAGTGSTFIYILVFVWCVTAAVILIKKAVGYAVFRNAVEKTGLRKQEGCPTIMVSDAVTSPFLMGVFRPVIVIPVSDLCRDELEMAVSHEKAHYQRHDTAKKAFAELLKSLNWFNPLFYMLTDELYESKIVYRTEKFEDKVRTFCMNPNGIVVNENTNGIVTVNGHSYEDPAKQTENTNFALLVEKHFSEPFKDSNGYGESIARLSNMLGGGVIVQRFGDLVRGRRSNATRIAEGIVTPTLSATPGDLSLVLPKRILDGIIEMIYALDKIAPGTANDDTLLYGVEVKFYNMEVALDEHLESRYKGLYMIGDGSGVTHSLSHASASGVFVAREILGLEEE